MFNKHLKFETIQGVHSVTYLIYKDKNKYKWNSIIYPKLTYKDDVVTQGKNAKGYIINIQQACFAGLVGTLVKNPDKNRIIYFFKDKNKLSYEQKYEWLLLNKKHGCLPKSFSIKKVLENKAAVFDINKQSYNMLYVYLSSVRFMPAEPSYVKVVLKLVNKFKLDFYMASVFACHISMSNINHHFLPENPNYMKVGNVDLINNINLSSMVGFYRFIKNNGEDNIENGNYHGFNVNSTIRNYCKLTTEISAQKLLNKGFSKVIRLNTDEAIKKDLIKVLANKK